MTLRFGWLTANRPRILLSMLDEKTYRRLLDDTLTRIDRAFDDVDPDLAESNLSQGALTIVMRGKDRLILSPQPSPRQLWIAFRDRAWHFDWHESQLCWLDDRGQNIQALTLVADLTKTATGLQITFPDPKKHENRA